MCARARNTNNKIVYGRTVKIVRMQRNALAQIIREALRSSGKTQDSVAREVGVHRGTISKWASGENIMRVEHADRLADALGIDRAELTRLAREAYDEVHPPTVSAKVGDSTRALGELLRNRFQSLESRCEELERRVLALESSRN